LGFSPHGFEYPSSAGLDVKEQEVPEDPRAHFAWLRTRLSAERTLEAWVRTSASMIGFGFGIVIFYDQFARLEGVAPARNPLLARYIGLALIGIGTASLGVAVWQYQIMIKYLHSEPFRGIAGIKGIRRLYPTVTVAMCLCVVGLLAFISILLRAVLR
jgi:putative membrane protein